MKKDLRDARLGEDTISTVATGQPRERYHWSRIVLHWLVVALVIVQYVTSAAMLRVQRPRHIFARPDPFDLLQHTIHIRIGLLIILLMAVRVALRWRFGAPQPVGDVMAWQTRAAQALHFALYAIILAQGITGAIAVYYWRPISTAHIVLFNILLGLVLLHVAAGLWHQFFLKDGALRRIIGI